MVVVLELEKIQIGQREPLPVGAEKINKAIDASGEASSDAASALARSLSAEQISLLSQAMSQQTQNQLDNIIIESGTSDAEVVQARKDYPVLNARLDASDTQLAEKGSLADVQQAVSDSSEAKNKANESLAKSNNPLGSMQTQGQKVPLDMLGDDVMQALDGNTVIELARGYFENNRGVEFPLRNAVKDGEIGTISTTVKNVILDAKVFGAKIGYFYRITMIANGFESNGKQRWGVTLEEWDIDSYVNGGTGRNFIFIYNDDTLQANSGNANWQKVSDRIETITVDNGDIALSVTIDREAISNAPGSANGLFLNLATANAPTAIIDPSNYFF